MRKFSIVVPTYHTPQLILAMLSTFERFKPTDVENHYIVVENSIDESYKDAVLSSSPHVTWVQNPAGDNVPGSIANGVGIQRGLEYVDDEFVFVAHCDVCATSPNFYEEMFSKRSEGYELIGTSIDNTRVNAIHQSGFYAPMALFEKCSYMPVFENGKMVLDVGDPLTVYCRENQLSTFCFGNTFNDESLVVALPDPYRSFHVDRCLDSTGKVMFMHLGRGVPKTKGTYSKANRVYLPEWLEFLTKNVV